MSLRLRLFLLLAGLVVLLVGTQAVLIRLFSDRLHHDVRTVAFRVGEEILSGFHFSAAGDDEAKGGGERQRVFVFGATAPPPAEETPEAGEASPHLRWIVHHETEVELTEHAGEVAAGAPGAETRQMTERVTRRLVLEPGQEKDVLFLRGASAAPRPIPIPRAEIAGTVERFRSQLLAVSLAIAALGVLAAAFAAGRIARPLRALAGAASRVGEGELGLEVPAAGAGARDELGVAVDAFNRMSRRLAELDAENRRLAESERLSELSEVARGLAHTLRNPLNALGLAVDELAARAPDGAGAADLVEGSRRQIRRIDGALRSFLALASAGEAAPEPVDLATLVREVALEALQDGGGRVRIEVDAAAGAVTLRAVPAEVRAAIQALVVNAVEASPAGARVRVAVTPRAGGGGRVEVEDEGPGLPSEVAARLFSPHTTTKPHGSGMGLFLAHRIAVGRYGGALALEPVAPGPGTRARLELGDRAGGDA